MPRVRAGGGARWARKAGQATVDYEAGVKDPRSDWAVSALAAESTYTAAVQESLSRKAWGAGVKKAGSGRWQEKSLQVGAGRYAPGVAAAQTDYELGVGPYQAAMERLQLPARGPKGSPQNLARVSAVMTAMRQLKVSQQTQVK